MSLIFRPLEAKLTRDTEMLGKMNPYCCFFIGDEKHETEVCYKGGKHPTWADSVTIPYSPDLPSIRVEIWDKERITHDDIIGAAIVAIDPREIQSLGRSKLWYPLFYKDKLAGEILVETSYQSTSLKSDMSRGMATGQSLSREGLKTFIFRPLEARLAHTTEPFSRISPYVALSLGNEKIEGSVCAKGVKNPRWDAEIAIPLVENANMVLCEVLDKNKSTSDNLIGSCMIDLRELQEEGGLRKSYTLMCKNEPAGELLLECFMLGSKYASSAYLSGFYGTGTNYLSGKAFVDGKLWGGSWNYQHQNSFFNQYRTEKDQNQFYLNRKLGSGMGGLPESLQTFVFRPIEAKLTHSAELLAKMSPYVVFILGNERIEGPVCYKGNKNPVWQTEIAVPLINSATMIRCEVMNKDNTTSDNSIGFCTINLQELQSSGGLHRWYPLTNKGKPAGEILLECFIFGSRYISSISSAKDYIYLPGKAYVGGKLWEGAWDFMGQSHFFDRYRTESEQSRFYTEQRQIIENRTFMKEVDVVETVFTQKEIEVLEPHKVMKEVQYTKTVPVTKKIETVEPVVVEKEVEVMEPRVVTKTIQVIENVPVIKKIEVVEMHTKIEEIETLEQQTFTKQIEVTEQVPVIKKVTVSEPVTVRKEVEFIEPVITTQTITKEIAEPVVVEQTIVTEVGPATMLGIHTDIHKEFAHLSLTERERLIEHQKKMRLTASGRISEKKNIISTSETMNAQP